METAQERKKAKSVYVEIWPGEKPVIQQDTLLGNAEINAIYKGLIKSNQQMKADYRRQQEAKFETETEGDSDE